MAIGAEIFHSCVARCALINQSSGNAVISNELMRPQGIFKQACTWYFTSSLLYSCFRFDRDNGNPSVDQNICWARLPRLEIRYLRVHAKLLNVAPMLTAGGICGSVTMVVPVPSPDNNTVSC